MSIESVFLSKKGQICTVTFTRRLKTYKEFSKHCIEKISTLQARVGAEYDNIQNVKDKREVGILPATNQGLSWGTWKDFPYIIEHCGQEYYRFTVLRNLFKPQTIYFHNKVERSWEDIRPMLLSSEFNTSDNDVFNIRKTNIIDLI